MDVDNNEIGPDLLDVNFRNVDTKIVTIDDSNVASDLRNANVKGDLFRGIDMSFNNSDFDLEEINIAGTMFYICLVMLHLQQIRIFTTVTLGITLLIISCDLKNEVLEIENVPVDANLIIAPKSKIQTVTTSIANAAIGIDGVKSLLIIFQQ